MNQKMKKIEDVVIQKKWDQIMAKKTHLQIYYLWNPHLTCCYFVKSIFSQIE
jgi:hypothetical protein